jgi:predicted TIM-barrel fold metal-dependent hydrolase
MRLAACSNVRISISAVECIFGMKWTPSQVAPWIHAVLDLFGTERTMFGSHRPISGLAKSFEALYVSYAEMTAGLSDAQRDAIFHGNAAKWFRLPMRNQAAV